jgi:signal transduction histidine kinase
VATVSHELKTPLASIRLLVDTLLDSDPDSDDGKSPNQTREYLQLISHENARLTRLIDGFLTFSRIEGGMQSFDFQRINLRDVAQQAAAVFQEHHESANTCLRKIVGDSCWVLGDTDLLVTAVVNLLENAWKYSEQDRLITLTTDAQDGQAMISVADNGIGMRPQNAKHVFDRFYQVDQRVARNRGGCGLGLSIVRAIIDSHDGTAHVESQSGIGSTFTILLPKLDLDQANIERVSQRENRV